MNTRNDETRLQRHPVYYVLALLALAVAMVAVAPARADDGSASQALDALSSVPGLVQASADVPVTTDAGSAVTTNDGATTVDVPTDPTDGVSLATDGGSSVSIGIPGAGDATSAQSVANGIVAYDGAATATLFVAQAIPASTDMTPGDGSSAAADQSVGAGVRILTVIQSGDAPSDFAFPLTLPAGATIVGQDDGSYQIVDSGGAVIAVIGAPWARDARNQVVPVTMSVDGSTLQMHVDTSEATFPVTVDPDLTSCVKAGPSGTAARRAAVVTAAEKWRGTNYSYGGGNACGQTNGQNGLGFDCSGLMMYAFAQVGFSLPHLTYDQVKYGTTVTSTSALQPGDLVFYNGNSHVGVYVGNGQVMQALGTKWGVNIWSLSWAGSISAMRRLIP